jgi:hypothetical protein
MKKQHFVPVLMSLFLIALSACQSVNYQSRADASTESEIETTVIKEDLEETSLSFKDENEIKPIPVKGSTDKSNVSANPPDVSPQEIVMIDGYEYHLIMDEAEYPNLINLISAVKNYGAQLYGIAFSDVFAILKDGETIAHMSSGYKSVLPEHADMIKAMFSEEYSGIQEDIDYVLKNNAPVEKEFYSISLNNGWLEINHM